MKKTILEKIRRIIGETNYTRFIFFKTQKYFLKLGSPESFSEKIQWTKLYRNLENLGVYVDKFEVRNYVKETIGSSYLIPCVGVYTDISEKEFEDLPSSFIIKATHASGWNYIVRNKNEESFVKIRDLIRNYSNRSFYEETNERNYKNIKGRVVIENLIGDENKGIEDYKFFCFHGEPFFIQVDSDRFNGHKRNLYNLDWEKIDIKYVHPNIEKRISKPECLEEMISISKKLSKNFDFVRVDLYEVDGNVYFGELTFTPGQGYERFSQKKFDYLIGEKWNLRMERELEL